jgi:glutathione-dependent peroxiredoxin
LLRTVDLPEDPTVPELVSREKQPVPDLTLSIRRDGEWTTMSTGEFFRGRTVVAFALPGAFTPTCSSEHLPRYDQLAPVFREHGVDEVVCIAVNDPYVMEEWGRDQGCRNVTLLPDGNGDFSAAMGMLVDKSDLNYGKRSWRYSMLVRDGIIEKMFVEPDKPGDPLEVSDADTMLDYLAADAGRPDQVAMLSKVGCPFCAKAKRLLDDAGIDYVEVPLPNDVRPRVVAAIADARSVPQVFVNGRLVGGSEDLERWLQDRRRPENRQPRRASA